MINFLIKKTIKNYKNINDFNVRENYTLFSAFFGIFINFLLIIIKLIIGLFTKSVSIIANGIDSMSDFGANIVTIVGTKIAKKPADKDHPFGHQRVEYITGLFVAILIVFMGGSVFFESVQKLINYDEFIYTKKIFYTTLIILFISILIKIYQAFLYRKIYKLTNSLTIKANYVDSFTDTISTLIIMFGVILVYIFQVNNIFCPFSIDGLLGIFESILIVTSGVKLIRNQIDILIGKPINKEFVDKINEYVKSKDNIIGTHDIICHMYGPNKCYMTMHVEVDSKSKFAEIHDVIDDIEHNVLTLFNVNLTIHMDPIDLNNPISDNYKEKVINYLKELSNELSIHDFRMIKKKKFITLIFDIVVPYDFYLPNLEITKYLSSKFNESEIIELKINYDQNYIE